MTARPAIEIGLAAAIVAVDGDEPMTLTAGDAAGVIGLPSGPFDPLEHQTFEIAVIETLACDAVTKENPADDTPARVQRDDDLGPKCVERTPHQSALRLIDDLSQIASAN